MERTSDRPAPYSTVDRAVQAKAVFDRSTHSRKDRLALDASPPRAGVASCVELGPLVRSLDPKLDPAYTERSGVATGVFDLSAGSSPRQIVAGQGRE